jgi:hypothetical protein
VRVDFTAPARVDVLDALLEGWVRANELLIPLFHLPPLYESGVVYRREPRGQERWKLAPQIYMDGYDDCEGLATVRAAELRLDGYDAAARVYHPNPNRGQLHTVVVFPDGRIEDPSRILGMGRQRRHR